MKKSRHLFYLFLLAISTSCLPPSWAATVHVEAIHSLDSYPLGGKYPVLFRLTISDPWYIHGPKEEGDSLIPTVLTFKGSSRLSVEDIRFPSPVRKKFDYATGPLEVFSGSIVVKATISIGENAPLGSYTWTGHLSYQACSSTACLPPEEIPLTLSALVVPKETPAKSINQDIFLSQAQEEERAKDLSAFKPGAGLLFTLLGLFLGGLALNLTPCIYPMIPITVSYFGGRSQKVKGHPVIHGLLYISGLALTNSMLGVTAALSGGMMGAALQNPMVLVFVAGVMIILSLSFFGLWEIQVPQRLARFAARNYGGFFGTFFMGLTLGIVAAPCIGPFILGLLTLVGQKGDPILGFLYFFILSIGMGLPLAILGIFSRSLERLPLSGEWMLWIKRLMGWVLIGMAAYVISPVMPGGSSRAWLLFCIAVAAGIHLGWMAKDGKGLRGFSSLKKASGLVLIGLGTIHLLSSVYGKEGIPWVPYDETIMEEARRKEIPVILDFYADWCSPCVAMDKEVFRDPEVVTWSRKVMTVRLNLTHRLPGQEEILTRYQVRGVPTVLFFNIKGLEQRKLRIESLVDRAEFLKRVQALLHTGATPGEILSDSRRLFNAPG